MIMKTASKKANSLIVALSILLLVGLVIPLVVFADESVKFDTSLMKTTDDPSTYTGGKDAVFAVDGDVLKLTYKVGINRTTKEFTYTPVTGFSNQTAMDWFGNGVTIPLKTKDNTTVKFNGTELSSDTSADSYFNITYKTEYVAPNMVVTYNLEIKPGVEIGSDFFSKNQVQIISQQNDEKITTGTYVEPTGPVAFDTSLMKSTDDPSTYTGGKDAAFAVDGDVLKLTYKVGINRTTKEFTYTPVTGFSNQTAMDWFGNGVTIPLKTKDNTTVKFNGTELSSDTSADSYFNITYKTEYVAPNMVVTYNLEIKPGVEIGSDFFSKNQVQIISQSNNETVIIGKYDGSVEPDPLKAAKTITPAEDYRVPTESNQVNNLQLRVNSDSDQNWAGKLTKVTYSFDGGEPVEMVLGKGGITSNITGDISYEYVDSGEVAVTNKYPDTIYIGIRYSFFQNQNIPKGETREYTFTFKADGYEDSVVKQTVRNPKEVLEVAVDKGVKYSFALEDLQKMWKDEGSKEYTYSVYDTIPDVLEQEKHYGPTLKTVLAASKIDLDSLADNDVIEFSTPSNISLGYKARITVKDLKEKRYAFPNGASPNKFKGTTAEQLEGKTEVPYIISLTGGENNLRNIFGQRDPQEEQKYDWVQYLGKITVYKGTATVYDGLTPSIESGSKVKEGDKLNFDFSTTGWQAGTASYAGIYYTVSTDGTEPADPTFSDIFYNYRQYGNPSYKDHPEYFNAYEFTNAEKTIIKAMIYIRGYEEPKVMTLTYTHDHAAAAAVKENEKAATCTEPGSYEEVVYCSECGAEISRETKTVEALGHTEVAIGEAKAATCTEAGITAGKKCSVCGETLEAQKELPALGHDWKVIPEVISTCTKKGSTAGVRCTRCGEYMLEPHEVPMVYHDYQNGKCTVCGAEDPDYKPDEPTPVEPDTKFTGLANEADKDGVWWYYTDGKIDKTHTGVDQNKYGWWRVENGKVNFNAQSIYQNQYGWWKTTDGEVTFKENSIYQNEYGWWKCKDSKVDFNAQSIYQNKYGWWKTTNGKVTFKEQGVYQNNYGWWKCKDSKVDFNANGKVTYNGKTYNVKNGKATLS